MLRRYSLFLLGLWFLAMGVIFIVRAGLGTTPISSENYVLSLHTPLTLGTWTFITNTLMILAQLWLASGRHGTRRDRIEILLQLPFSVVFGAFLDINMWLTSWILPSHYTLQIVILLAGCTVQALGIVLQLRADVVMMSAEGMVKYISRRTRRPFGTTKVYLDTTLVLIAIALGLILGGKIEGVREGTVIAALITGRLVSAINKAVTPS